MMDVAIELKDVTKIFGKRKILDNISLSIKKGKIYGLLGPSGSGKSTIINILCGMYEQTSGEIKVLGKKKAKERIGLVPQEYSVYDELSVWSNLVYFGKLYSVKSKTIKKRAKKILEEMMLYEHRKLPAKELSGGMKRRLNIACALIHDPDIILLDEPTVGLDPVTRRAIWQILKDINSMGKTLLFTTHFMDEVEFLCDELALLQSGSIIVTGNVKDLIAGAGMVMHIDSEPGDEGRIVKELKRIEKIKNFATRFGHTIITLKEGETFTDEFNSKIKDIFKTDAKRVLVKVLNARLDDLFFLYTERGTEKENET
jgi:ABC-2 type transport system ATP-binding protein